MKLGFIIGAMFAFAQGGLVSQPLISGSLGGFQDKSLIQGNFIQGGFQGQPLIQNTIQGFQSLPLIQSGLQSLPLNPGSIIQGGPLIQGNFQGGFQGVPLIQNGGFQSQPVNQLYIQTGYPERPSVRCGQTKNAIKNGNFLSPMLGTNYRTLRSLTGWQVKEIEQGIGSVYNAVWGNTVVIQLDGNQNDFIRQKVDLSPGSYNIEFDYAARSGHIQSSALSVHWNGQKVQFIQATDGQKHRASIPVQSNGGTNTLQIRGEGQSDTYGMTLTNVQVEPCQNSSPLPNPNQYQYPYPYPYPDVEISGQPWRVTRNQYFVNSDFESPTLSKGYVFLKQLPGWSVRQIEQGIGTTYNRRWGNKVVIQLDANRNEQIFQTVRLNRGVYRFEMNYAAREGYANSAKLVLSLNDNILQQISATDEEIHKVFFAFEVNQPGDFVFGIHADGQSDTYGMTVGQVSLFSVQGQVKRVDKTQEIICYNSNGFRVDPRNL